MPKLPTVEALVSSLADLNQSSRWDGPALCRSLGWRVDQILRSRDRLLSSAFAVPLDQGPTDEIASEVDTIVLYSMSVLDITARLAEMLFQTKVKVSPGWQQEQWLRKLKEHAPETAKLFDENSTGITFMRVITLVRNTIHAEAFSASSVTFVVGTSRFQPLVRLPVETAEKLCKWFNQLGGSQGWGFVESAPVEGKFIHLGIFAERLCNETLRISNSVLKVLIEDDSMTQDLPPGIPHEMPLSVSDVRALLQAGLAEFAGSPFRDEPVALDERGNTLVRIKRTRCG